MFTPFFDNFLRQISRNERITIEEAKNLEDSFYNGFRSQSPLYSGSSNDQLSRVLIQSFNASAPSRRT